MKIHGLVGLAFGVVLFGSTGCDLGDQDVGDENDDSATEGGSSSGSSGGGSGSSGGGSGSEDGDSSGIEGACEGYPFQATAEQLAATPRADADAETLAMLFSGALTAPDALYDRVVLDLAAIRAEAPMLVDLHARPPWGVDGARMPVSFDEEGTVEMQAGTYDGWDCPNEHYGATAEPGALLEDTAYVSFGDKRLNLMRLAEEYFELPNVIYTEVPGNLDGSYICLEQDGDEHRYLFALGGGDCPSGCTEWTHWEYTVDAAGMVTFDGESEELPAGWTARCGWE